MFRLHTAVVAMPRAPFDDSQMAVRVEVQWLLACAHRARAAAAVVVLPLASVGSQRQRVPMIAKEREELRNAVEELRDVMIAVATGGPKINEVERDYKSLRQSVRVKLSRTGIDDPNPYRDLWKWYGKWSSGDLPTYASRREYIRDLFGPLLDELSPTNTTDQVRPHKPTGWERVDRCLDSVQLRLPDANHEEDFQVIGHQCREVLISLAQAVYDADKHATEDGVEPSKTDAKRMLDAYIATELSGSSNAYARKHAKSSLDLANQLQHKRTATRREALLCAEATTSVVNLVAIVSGRREA